MKQYKTTTETVFAKCFMVVLVASLCALYSCKDDSYAIDNDHNVTFTFTRAGDTPSEQIPSMRLFTFYNDNGAANDSLFHQEVLSLTRNLSANQVSAQVETGIWNMVLLSTPNGGNIIPPVAGTKVSKLPMYKYQPTVTGSKSSDAHEIFLDNRATPNITSGGSHAMSAQLNRTVAKVELIFEKTTPNFNLSGTHSIKLHHVPSTISYTGALLPSQTAPDTLSGPLQSSVTLQNAGNGSYEGADTISFIIPAHRGTDAFNYSGNTPNDTTTLKMGVTVDLQRTGDTRFTKFAEIPVVAKANMILRVHITVNDGLEFKTEVLDWQGVPLEMTVGAGYQNWLYVKKGATGNGISWSDALPDISTAIAKATELMTAGKTVNGVLVAGGSGLIYNEGFDIPQNVKVYGGWEGTPGTELAAGDVTAVYTSTNRDLKTYKARVNTGNENIVLNGANAILDGFAISGSGANSTVGLVSVFNATAWINAVEIDQQASIVSTYALSISTGTGTNILVSRNNKGVSVAGSGKLVNATIANNTTASSFSGTLLNTIYWGNAGTATTAGTINYCAFQGTVPTGTNYPLNDTNDAWFTTANLTPGPHFNQMSDASKGYFEVGTANPNRAPQLGRGDQTSFDNATPTYYRLDINGNARHYSGTDIGCYESAGSAGFQLQWNMDALYLSPKMNVESEHPAILFNNDEEAYVEWEISIVSATNYTLNSAFSTGSGNSINLGLFKLTTTVANTTNTQYDRGSVKLTSKLGVYLPETTLKVYQTPGQSSVWTTGYVGSFHRWDETGERYIQGTNSGAWTVRIISGIDWIKVDTNERGYNNGEVVETFGGAVTGTGNIVFRVGMKSLLEDSLAKPRYGLIVIQRTGGIALFFVRQGERTDFLYSATDPRTGGRAYAREVSPYNLTGNMGTDTSVSVGLHGGRFVDYPTKTGAFFQWARTVAYTSDPTKTSYSMAANSETAWGASSDPCPTGYHVPSIYEFGQSYYLDRTDLATGHFNSNFAWGRYADGYYDVLHNGVSSAPSMLGSGNETAYNGILMYNDFDNAAVFIPIVGARTNAGALHATTYAWYWTSTRRTESGFTSYAWVTHWQNSHIGMNCTNLNVAYGASIRCVKDE